MLLISAGGLPLTNQNTCFGRLLENLLSQRVGGYLQTDTHIGYEAFASKPVLGVSGNIWELLCTTLCTTLCLFIRYRYGLVFILDQFWSILGGFQSI